MPYPGLLHPEPLPLQQSTADPCLHRRHSNTALPQSLWELWLLVHTRFVWALWVSLVEMGFDSKCDFSPATILLGLLCPWTWGISSQTLTDFIFLGSKITADGNCSHEIKRRLLFGRKVMTNLDCILKSRDITILTKVYLVKAMVFPVVIYGCESWTIKKAEH